MHGSNTVFFLSIWLSFLNQDQEMEEDQKQEKLTL
jgi:hypothetical protein